MNREMLEVDRLIVQTETQFLSDFASVMLHQKAALDLARSPIDAAIFTPQSSHLTGIPHD